MKKTRIIISMLFAILLISACNNEKSLQSYLVESESKADFSFFTFPVATFLLLNSDASDALKETIKSVKKVNVAFLKKTADNDQYFKAEKATLKKIFKNKTYKSLGRSKIKEVNISFYYTGETASINEIIIFGYSKNMGVGVARLIGNEMNPAKIIEMLTTTNFDKNSKGLEQLSEMFNNK